jgi:hypothetical protein
MKTIDLSDLKEGDNAWSCAIGECRVTDVFENVVQCNGTHEYNFDGTFYEDDDKPTLFHSKEEFLEYWGFGATLEVVESNQLTKREQFAMAAMQGLLSEGVWSSYNVLAYEAINAADALLTKLNEKS